MSTNKLEMQLFYFPVDYSDDFVYNVMNSHVRMIPFSNFIIFLKFY